MVQEDKEVKKQVHSLLNEGATFQAQPQMAYQRPEGVQ